MFKKIVSIAALSLLLPWQLHAQAALETKPEEPNQQQLMDDVRRFSYALSLIKRYYVTKTNDSKLFDHAIAGMLSGLDPHSSYLDEKDFEELQTTTNGNFGGLGIEVTMEDGAIKVISPLVDTPAYKAGIKTGDYIVKLNAKAVQGLELKEAVNLMRGPAGSNIELTVIRKGETKPLFFTVMREKIDVKSVQSRLLEDHYGYIRLTQFQTLTDKEMHQALDTLKQQSKGKLSGLVLDLRNNPGGLLDAAIQVSGDFLDKIKNGRPQKIVSTRGRVPGSEFTAMANANDLLNKAPMVVLINGGSASASEIVAGALKDNARAIIVGTRSFGKGSVQTVLPLDEKRGIKLTTALYFTPAGISIQAEGIKPDIVVEELAVADNKTPSLLASFSESTLNGHLDNANQAATTLPGAKKNVNKTDDANLAKKDYQLYTALTILKSLAVAQR